ncbi:MAG TPA: DUF3226 domain-containing protein [Longimicrobium sp.]|jgi:hypothetical protein
MADPAAPLTPARLLWVEGKDDQAVVHGLCAAHQVPAAFRVEDQGGVEKLLRGIGITVRAQTLERFGVVVDANGDAWSRWQELRRIAEREGYQDVPDAPTEAGTILPASALLPRLGIWIMPDNGSPGALEDFAAALVPSGDALWTRAGEAVDAIPEADRRFPTGRRSKAHIHTWLAWQEQPGSPMGQAIGKGDLDAHAPAAHSFVAWLRRLMVDER